MKLFHYFRSIYTLDTLDTRFTSSRSAAIQAEASPSKWRTSEFYFYYLVHIVVVPLMFKVSYDVSKDSHPNYSKYAHLLSPGWIPGRQVDNSDAQYASFRNNIPYMFLVLLLHPCLRHLYNAVFPVKHPGKTSSSSSQPNGHIASASTSTAACAHLNQRLSFDLYFALVFLCALHGFSALKILLILCINYTLTTRLPRHYIPPATWVFNIGILFANELCSGYPFASIARLLRPAAMNDNNKTNWGTIVDSYSGLIPRWEILFNLTVLRLISFNLDYYWNLSSGSASPLEKKQLDPSNLSERDRISLPPSHTTHAYSFSNYLSYALYSPLYLTGPILTYNDYISQSTYPLPTINTTRTLLYAVRFLLSLLSMELILHYIYTVAISKSQPNWSFYSPFQLSMLGFFHLHIIWLKLLLPWRFFRLWSLIDGIDPPENMVRCMSNNYSALAFWRGWHRSFNKWIIRYIYIPMGGSGPRSGSRSSSSPAPNRLTVLASIKPLLTYLTIFTFVALWHDINLRLLMWGWLITLFILPEVFATLLFPRRAWSHRPTAYRVICAVGAVANILMMMAANLVGFAVGLDGLRDLVAGIVGDWFGLCYLLVACAALFVGVQVMFEIREEEARQGIRLKC